MRSSKSVEIKAMAFSKEERSYYSTPNGRRLATFEEAREGLEIIKEQNILKKWDRARLLDGWITGPGYDFEMGNDFKGCLGYMLLIQTEASGCAYADVHLSELQKQVALFLCVDDCNYEVVYWLLNSWAKTDSMDLQDVIRGEIPFSDPATFKEMNNKVSSLARKLGDKGIVSEEAEKRLSWSDWVNDKKSDLIKVVNEENIWKYHISGFVSVAECEDSCFPWPLEPKWLAEFAKQGGAEWYNIAAAILNFLSESFAGTMVEFTATLILANICKKNGEPDLKTLTSSQKNFMVASFILFYLSTYRTDIIHTPLAHGCFMSCAAEMIRYVASNNGSDDLPRLSQTLQNNAMWRCYDHNGNYDLLNKLLVLAASPEASGQLQTKERADILVVNNLLEWGAQPGPAYAILGFDKVTALQSALSFPGDEDIKIEIAKSLLSKCNKKQQEDLANAPDEDGWTSLHNASLAGEAKICQMLLNYGAKLNLQAQDDKTALHIAVEYGRDAVVDVFIKHPHCIKLVDLPDSMGKSPLDRAVAPPDQDAKLVAKLLSKSEKFKDYFDKVNDREELLRYSLLDGSVHIVSNLLGTKLAAGECDDEGKTALHLAAMCEDDSKAEEMACMVLTNIKEKKKLVAKSDRRWRTALHEAALKGNINLCEHLLKINPEIIDFEDRDGRSAIYDAVKGKENEEGIIKMLLRAYPKKDTDRKGLTPLHVAADRKGLTPLHVAASLGKMNLVKLLLSRENGKEYLKRRDPREALEYLKMSDFRGQTALHKAASCGDSDTVEFLLKKGAHPLEERDCDGRTALHYAVKGKIEKDKKKLIDLLLEECKTNEEKWLLLWASAAGLGTADQSLNNDDPLQKYLEDKKQHIEKLLPTGNLLQTATSMGDIEMTKELIARGYQIADIRDTEWRQKLPPEREEKVKRVSGQLKRIAERGNDQPTVLDNLGRDDYARGLAALLLNPYIKPPIVVGISGSWGMGKSSLMVQTESTLLKTAAQMALLQSARLSSSASKLPAITTCELSNKGKERYEEIKRYVDFQQKGNRTLFSIMVDKFWSWIKNSSGEDSRAEIGHTEQDSLVEFLNSYQVKYRKIFKSLAAMDSSDMFTTRSKKDQEHQNSLLKSTWRIVRDMFTTKTTKDREHQNSPSKSMWRIVRDMFTTNDQRAKSSPQQSTEDSPVEESVPAVLTVQYNAWKYRNETEALAGIAVEITKELEGIMTEAQWLSTCCRNTWKKKKYNILIEIIYPCLLAVVLACAITWILWVILDRLDKFRDWAIAKYACLPITIVIIGWTVTKSVVGILKPVSTQLLSYISFPDHTDKLGYHERVISDINFLKDEIGRRPYMVFKAYSWVFTMISTLWLLFFEWWVTPLFFHPRFLRKAMLIPKIAPAFRTNLRIIVFIDDLDRCQESVVLQVLSAINLVLAVCEINVVLGIDKGMIEKAIIKKHGDTKTNRSFKDNQELADKYLQKIIQLPLDLPDPSKEQSRKFLEEQLGVFQEPSEGTDSESKSETGMAKNIMPEAGRSRESTSPLITERETGSNPDDAVLDVAPATKATGYSRPRINLQFFKQQLCKLFFSSPSVCCGRKDEMEATTSDAAATGRGGRQQGKVPVAEGTVNKSSNRNDRPWIPIRELLFVRYSKREQHAFGYFQNLATESRKLPREWKRHLTYHRLVWNILYLTGEAKDLAGWQVQLITWLFVCWEWRENMDIVIQNWDKIGILRTLPSDELSLQRIVDHFTELERGASHEEDETKEAIPKVSVSKDKTIEMESSERGQKKLEEAAKDNFVTADAGPPLFRGKKKKKKKSKTEKEEEEMMNKEIRETSLEGNIDVQKRSRRAGPEKLDTSVNKQLDTLEKTLRKELDELKKEIKDLKDEVMKQQSRKNEKREEEKRMKLKRWDTLSSALNKYDVPMDAILVFQRFRFYCIAGHLSWPLPE